MTESNRLPILAAEIGALHREVEALSLQSAEKALSVGAMLCEAKELIGHGEWSGWLKDAGLRDRTAQRYMQIARSPLNASQVTDLGGVARALSFLSALTMPDDDKALHICIGEGEQENFAFVWPAEGASGFFHIAAVVGENCIRTKRPIPPIIEVEGQKPVHTVIEWLGQNSFLPLGEWRMRTVSLTSANAVIMPMVFFTLPGVAS